MDSNSAEWRAGPSIPTVCRCCLAEGCYKDISTEYFWMGKREVYAEMLTETFDISIAYSHSGGPNSQSRLICEPCISRLRDASEFKRQVQECEKTFLQHLDPGRDMSLDAPTEIVTKEVKIEAVKLEKSISDDDDNFDDHMGFGDDDDDDLDDQPLTRLATKTPKKESVDILDLLDNAKAAEKRKCTIKLKSTPAKKVKKDGRLAPKATTSKQQPKPEAKKKETGDRAIVWEKRNAEIILNNSSVYPFRVQRTLMCIFCIEEFDKASILRQHFRDEYAKYNISDLYYSRPEFPKVDCSNLKCNLCLKDFSNLKEIAKHLIEAHEKKINLDYALGLIPFNLHDEKYICMLCDMKLPSLVQLSRHTVSAHYTKFTCHVCAKPYATADSLNCHIKLCHSMANTYPCRKCMKLFSNANDRLEHVRQTVKCQPYCCMVDGCLKRFMSSQARDRHKVQAHSCEQPTYTCYVCNKSFGTCRKGYYRHFKIHMKGEQKIKPTVPCEVCLKVFASKRSLKQHMWIHSEVKKFTCNICNRPFNQNVCYKSHMKKHHPDITDI